MQPNSRKVDIQALVNALPVSGLAPQRLAFLGGLVEVPKDRRWEGSSIDLLEPPAGKRIPFVEPVQALRELLRHQGLAPEAAELRALKAVALMKSEVRECQWVNFFNDLDPESPVCLPFPDFVAWLRSEHKTVIDLEASVKRDARGSTESASNQVLVSSDIVDFLERAAEAATSTPMFHGPDNWDEPWSLQDLPTVLPKAVIEFVPGPPWANIDVWGDCKANDNPFLRWREGIRPVSLELEKALGQPVYRFADLNSDIDDDDVHRFLLLHWCCTWKPESEFVRYLVKVSGAKNVEELKAGLIDPDNYTQPFEMNDSFFGLEALTCRIDYLPQEMNKTVAVVFFTVHARNVAESLLSQKIGAHALIVSPKELATVQWVKQATRNCRDWTSHYVYEGKLHDPIAVLAGLDELYVIADEKAPSVGFDLKLSERVEDLLWLALDLGVEAKYFYVNGMELSNPDACLRKRGVPERVAARREQRADFTMQMKEIRVANDFGSSGLWDGEGKCLGYDLLDLPFPLVRRIAAWQLDYYETMTPPNRDNEEWYERHEHEALEIAKAMQGAFGRGVAVKLYRHHGWLTINEIDDMDGGQA